MEIYLWIIGGMLVSFTITYISIPSIVKVAHLKAYYDTPDDRKVHKKSIPSLGGVAVFAGLVIASSTFGMYESWKSYQYIIASLVILFFIGIKDDILIIAPRKKFIGQAIASVVIVLFTDLRITSLQGIFLIYEIHPVFSILLSGLIVLAIINAYNFIDGIDGLAASLGILSSSVFGVWFTLSGNINIAVLAFCLTGSLIAFLRYNLSNGKNKVFMGDTGAMITGFLLAVMMIEFINANNDISLPYTVLAAPAISFGIVIVPLFDLLRTIFVRIFINRSLSSPDRNHIHHQLLRLGLSHKKSTLILVSVNAFFILLLFLLHRYGSIRLVLISLLLCMVLSYIPGFLYQKKKK